MHHRDFEICQVESSVVINEYLKKRQGATLVASSRVNQRWNYPKHLNLGRKTP
jgi:hypothetical protein